MEATDSRKLEIYIFCWMFMEGNAWLNMFVPRSALQLSFFLEVQARTCSACCSQSHKFPSSSSSVCLAFSIIWQTQFRKSPSHPFHQPLPESQDGIIHNSITHQIITHLLYKEEFFLKLPELITIYHISKKLWTAMYSTWYTFLIIRSKVRSTVKNNKNLPMTLIILPTFWSEREHPFL